MRIAICESCREHPAQVSFKYSRSLCYSCFSALLERRCRIDLRRHECLEPLLRAERVLLIEQTALEGMAAEQFLHKLNPKLTVFRTPTKNFSPNQILSIANEKKAKLIALAWSIERECSLFLKEYLTTRTQKTISQPCLKSSGRLIFKVFRNARIEELKAYLKCEKVKIPEFEVPSSDKPIYRMLSRMERQYPEIKFSLLSSADKLVKIRKTFGKGKNI
ncbi:MAG: hypothetical protein QW471_04215 [Candidatus Woesearchaeota archaeon]